MAKRSEELRLPGGWTWEQTADWLGVSVRTAHELADLGELETFSLGARITRVKPESCVRLRERGFAGKSVRPPRRCKAGESA
jgi:hypothetical protein